MWSQLKRYLQIGTIEEFEELRRIKMIISTITGNRGLVIITDEEKIISSLSNLFLVNNVPYSYIQERRSSCFCVDINYVVDRNYVVDALYYITHNQELLIT